MTTTKSAIKPASRSAQIIPFPKPAAKGSRALNIAIGKIDRALDEQLIAVRQFRDSTTALKVAVSKIQNTQRRIVADLGTTELGLRGIAVQSRTLADSMEVCERLLRAGGTRK